MFQTGNKRLGVMQTLCCEPSLLLPHKGIYPMFASLINRLTYFFNKKKLKKCLNLGGVEKFSEDYSCVGLSSEFKFDLTKKLPFENDIAEFIWSERMLEHIRHDDLYKVFLNIKRILKSGARARFCLPSSFYIDDISIDMMRSGNSEKQKKHGHVTFFTYEGYGPISDEYFGTASPPKPAVYFAELFDELDLNFKLIRYHTKDKKTIFNKDLLLDVNSNRFNDRTEILIKRPNSLIFDISKR
jgi:SAM-dependent methyltransferase